MGPKEAYGWIKDEIKEHGFDSAITLPPTFIIIVCSYIGVRSVARAILDLPWYFETSILFGVLAVYLFFWLIYRYKLPRAGKQEIGILIAATYSDKQTEDRFKNDFIQRIDHRSIECGTSLPLRVLVLRSWQAKFVAKKLIEVQALLRRRGGAERIADKKIAKKWLHLRKYLRCYFYFWGHIRSTKVSNAPTFIGEMGSIVLHRELGERNRAVMRNELSRHMPNQIQIPSRDEYQDFLVAADFIADGVEYMLGLAAFASGDFKLAAEFHGGLNKRVGIQSRFPKLNHYLIQEQLLPARMHIMREEYGHARPYIDKAFLHKRDDYEGLLLRAIVELEEGHPTKALNTILQARAENAEDISWRFSLAFLYLIVGNYEKSVNQYKKLASKQHDAPPDFFAEMLRYCQGYLHRNPDEKAVHYAIGMINKMVGNQPAAFLAFDVFLKELWMDDQYQYLLTRAADEHADLEKMMGIA